MTREGCPAKVFILRAFDILPLTFSTFRKSGCTTRIMNGGKVAIVLFLAFASLAPALSLLSLPPHSIVISIR